MSRSGLRDFLGTITRNPLGLFGSAVVTTAALLIGMLVVAGALGFGGGPYTGILTYLILPTIFLLGLLLIPLGYFRERRRAARLGARRLPVVDLNDDGTRRRALVFVAFSAINVLVLATATLKGVEVLESTEFCGEACHSVMRPEAVAHVADAHASVACVDCHVGPGAGGFLEAKLQGAWQVVSVNLDLYPRPIRAHDGDLATIAESCTHCHDRGRSVGDVLRVYTHHADDASNTRTHSVLAMHVDAIHWHADPRNVVRYLADASRETVHEVEVSHADGSVERFRRPDADPPGEDASWRTMDCLDCHNRPAHGFRLAEEELDRALVEDRIDASLPYVYREGLALLRAEYADRDAAAAGIPAALAAFYTREYPEIASGRADAIRDAGSALVAAYEANVFPAMRISWGTYPKQIGHESSPGCFRCHDSELENEDGDWLEQDCEQCHGMLAWEEEDPEILSQLGR